MATRSKQATYPLPISADWKLDRIIAYLTSLNHSFRVDYPAEGEGDITLFVLKEDIELVRKLKLTEPCLTLCHTLDLDEAKTEMASVINECLEADNDSAYLIKLINQGHAPTAWAEEDEEILYAEEDPDDETQILLYVKAAQDKTQGAT